MSTSSSQFAAAFAPAAASSTVLHADRSHASVYGPAATRGANDYARTRDDEYAQYQQYAPAASSASGGFSQTARSTGGQQAFYNTVAGEEVIAQARSELAASARQQHGEHYSHRAAAQDNRQRAFHAECVLPANLATDQPTVAASFTQYPLQEYNRFDIAARAKVGPSTHPRLKAVSRRSAPLDVQRRHDLVKSLHANQSISNHNHGLPFIAKHTNNLVSC